MPLLQAALSVRIDPPACPQIKAWLGREAIQNSPLLRMMLMETWFEKMPKRSGSKGSFAGTQTSQCHSLRLWGVLLFVQLFNPSRTFLCFLKVKQSCVQDAGRVDFAEVGFDDLGTRFSF